MEIGKRLSFLAKIEAFFVVPTECLSVSKLPEAPQWMWKIDLDGYRRLLSRNDQCQGLFEEATVQLMSGELDGRRTKDSNQSPYSFWRRQNQPLNW